MIEDTYTGTLTLEGHLKHCAQNSLNAGKLLESFHIIKEQMHKNLKSIISIFPHYSEHDDEHSENIISSLERLLGEKRIRDLPPGDTWAILISAYMHDVGMIVLDEELQADWETDEFQNMLSDLTESTESEIKEAAKRLYHCKVDQSAAAWPVLMKRDVILLAAEFYRGKHPDRAVKNMMDSQRIRKHLDLIISGGGTIPERIQNTVAQIAASHGGSFEAMLKRLEPKDSVCGLDFHPRYVAALLRLGDLCDLDNGRFNAVVLKSFGKLTESNYVHYFKHNSIETFYIAEDQIRVVSNVRFKELITILPDTLSPDRRLELCHQVVMETKHWLTWMEKEIQNIKLHWQELADHTLTILSPSLTYKILVDGKQTVTSEENLRFSFSNEKAYTLIEGYSLYDDQLIFIRELIQNSLDALKIQFWRDVRAGHMDFILHEFLERTNGDYTRLRPFDFSDAGIYEKYQVQVRVNHREGEPAAKVIIEDNGTGISLDDLKNRILKTGSSWHKDQLETEIAGMPDWLKPTGSFGIGLHSVFALADSIYIETSTEADPELYHIILHSGKRDGYVFMNASSDKQTRYCGSRHGTKITIPIEMDRWDKEKNHRIENDSDPMGYCSESRFCSAIHDKMKAILKNPLFRITLWENELSDSGKSNSVQMPVLYQNEKWEGLFDPHLRDRLIHGEAFAVPGMSYAFSGIGRRIAVWDDCSSSLLYFRFGSFGRDFSVFCKGILVQDLSAVDYDFAPWPALIAIDLLGGDSSQRINIARSQLTQKSIDLIKERTEQSIRSIASLCRNTLLLLIKDTTVVSFFKDIRAMAEGWPKECSDGDLIDRDIAKLTRKYSKAGKNGILERCFIYEWTFKLLASQSLALSSFTIPLEEKAPDPDKLAAVFFKQFKKETIFQVFVNLIHLLISNIARVAGFFIPSHNDAVELFINKLAEVIANTMKQQGFSDQKFCDSFGHTIGSLIRKEFTMKQGIKLDDPIFLNLFARGFEYQDTFPFGSFTFFHNLMKPSYFSENLNSFCCLPVSDYLFLSILYTEESEILVDCMKPWIIMQPENRNTFSVVGAKCAVDILKAEQITIKAKDVREFLKKYPYYSYCPCDSISLSMDGELCVSLNCRNKHRRLGRMTGEQTLLAYLNCYNNRNFLSAFYQTDSSLCRALTVNFRNIETVFLGLEFYQWNDMIPLWMEFWEMVDQYGSILENPENKEVLIEEIMTSIDVDGRGVPNLLRYIYHHNPNFTKEDSYEEAMEEIEKNYRKLVSIILDCVISQIAADKRKKAESGNVKSEASFEEETSKPED